MILITGGAGYIGSHCAVEFLKDGFDVLIFDNFSTGHREIIQNIQSKYKSAVFCEGDLRNKSDEYKIICSCSSTYLGTKNNVERSDIEKDGSRNIITFDNWSDIGYGFTITLKKIKK